MRAPLCGVERRASPRLGLGLGLGHKPRFGGSASRVRRTCRGTSSVQEDVHTSSSSSVSTEDVDYASLAAKIDNVKERGLQLPSYAEADLAAALEELKKLDGMREGHADDLTMRWFLKDRDLDVSLHEWVQHVMLGRDGRALRHPRFFYFAVNTMLRNKAMRT